MAQLFTSKGNNNSASHNLIFQAVADANAAALMQEPTFSPPATHMDAEELYDIELEASEFPT